MGKLYEEKPYFVSEVEKYQTYRSQAGADWLAGEKRRRSDFAEAQITAGYFLPRSVFSALILRIAYFIFGSFVIGLLML